MKTLIQALFFFFTFLNISQAQYPPVSPKWVFEPWVWEDAADTKQATWDLINGYINRDIPVGAVIIDSPWEEPSNSGYNTFVFDPIRYSQPKEFIDSLNSLGIHVILWITGVMTTDCSLYEEAYKNNYFINGGATTSFWKGSGLASHIDFFNQDAVAYWRSLMDQILDNYNVDGWKVDESDYYLKGLNSITTAAGNKTPTEYSNAYYSEMYNYTYSKRGDNGMITARPYCDQHNLPYWFAPVSINTAGWVGDQYHTWDGLQHALKNIFISAAAGYAAVGSDIGGYYDSNPDKTLFLRWAQLGALVPIMENGGAADACHQPWLFDENSVDVYRYFADLHHELVPYIYSYDIVAHLTATSILRPFGARGSPPDTNSWIGDWKYLLGDNLFVAAIYQNDTSRTITFPEGLWINYWNEDDIHQGGTTSTLDYSIEQYPLFIRSGSIIPLNVDNSVTGHGSEFSKNYLTLLVYPDGLSSYQYYTNESVSTEIKCDEGSNKFTISFSKSTGSLIIRLSSNIEPENVKLSGNENLYRKSSSSDYEKSSSGWFYGKMSDDQNIYTWIKFIDAVDTVYVTTTCNPDLHPVNYELSDLNEGNKYYVDREYTLTTIPDEYKGYYMIKTANEDKSTSNLDFHFNICNGADIYIAYDHRISTPFWITSNYLETGNKIYVSDINLEYFNIWKRTTQPGVITFGDNEGDEESSMYFVFCDSDEPLSVGLTSFTASINQNVVNLKWNTATEVNNYGFEVERRSKETGEKGQNNKFTWEKIGFVEGGENSNSPRDYSFTDKNLTGVSEFTYRLKQIDNDGTYSYSNEVQVEVVPNKYELYQNYPNPFNPTTTINYSIPKQSYVTLKIYDILGREVKTLVNEEEQAGNYEVEFSSASGVRNLASGIYFFRLRAGNFVETKKMILLR